MGDLYGTGSDDFVSGGASSSGFAYGTHYSDGGHVRIYNDHGGLVCSASTNEEVDSSPAVGPILPGGAYGIATGTGSFFPGASDENTVKVFDTKCNQVWSDDARRAHGRQPRAGRRAGQRPARRRRGHRQRGRLGNRLGPERGDRRHHLVQDLGPHAAIFGSVTTADLYPAGGGYQDVIVPTTYGLYILDGQTGPVVADVDDGSGNGGVQPPGAVVGFQNAPLVTAGRQRVHRHHGGRLLRASAAAAHVQGVVQHFEVDGLAVSPTPTRRAGGPSSTTTRR